MDLLSPPYHFYAGKTPLLISIPHVGTAIPPSLQGRFTSTALKIPDTDWHLDQLYSFAKDLGASMLVARYSRYLIDLNRPPNDTNLYPGQDTTGLCPLDTFAREPLYQEGHAPKAEEISERLARVWQPYHQQLQQELARLRNLYPRVVLWDAHSIGSKIPRFFSGQLPDFNWGTADHQSADPALAKALMKVVETHSASPPYSQVLNGRFKGGYITRQYGVPAKDIHAIQLELSWQTYMNETFPYDYLPNKAKSVQKLLQALIETTLRFAQGAPL